MTSQFIQAFLVLAAFYIASLTIDRAIKQFQRRFDSTALETFRLISNSQRAILLFIGIVLALSKLGFDVAALVADVEAAEA